MTVQEIAACVLGLIAGGYLVLRVLRRRAGNCCGERECPAAKEMTRKLETLRPVSGPGCDREP